MKVNLLVNCQYFENYNIDSNGWGEVPHWKPKGGHTFVIRDFDPDFIFYDEDQVVQAIKALVASKATVACKFEYLSHEVVFGEPEVIELNEFMTHYNETIAQ